MAHGPDPHEGAGRLDERVDPCSHSASEPGQRTRLLDERLEEDRLGHPNGVGILGGNLPEFESGGRLSADKELLSRQRQMRFFEDVLDKPHLIEQMRNSRLQHLAAKLTIEALSPTVYRNFPTNGSPYEVAFRSSPGHPPSQDDGSRGSGVDSVPKPLASRPLRYWTR